MKDRQGLLRAAQEGDRASLISLLRQEGIHFDLIPPGPVFFRSKTGFVLFDLSVRGLIGEVLVLACIDSDLELASKMCELLTPEHIDLMLVGKAVGEHGSSDMLDWAVRNISNLNSIALFQYVIERLDETDRNDEIFGWLVDRLLPNLPGDKIDVGIYGAFAFKRMNELEMLLSMGPERIERMPVNLEQGWPEGLQLISEYERDPTGTSKRLRLKIGSELFDSRAADTFALMIFHCDDFVSLKAE